MDTLTHLTLGACTGELLLGKRLGKRAMLYGAIAANIPDIDIVAGLFLPADKALLFHRSITHSLLFALVIGLCLAWLAKKYHPKISGLLFAVFFCFELALHDLLDTCTSYGTGLLEPFSHQRFSFHLLYVADPLFTIPLLIVTIILIAQKTNNRQRINWVSAAIGISALYVCFAVYCKSQVDNKATLTTPAPFNCMLWYCIIKTDTGYYTGYQSIFDKQPPQYEYHPQSKALLKHPEPVLTTFADGYYTISKQNDAMYFNVLRFGQIQGWQTKDAPFALSYPLGTTASKNMIVQKGRFAGWNAASIKLYFERIAGK